MNNNGKGESTVLVTEDELAKNNVYIEDKLRNRAISEGYKYRSLDESLSSEASSDNDTVKRAPETIWAKRYKRLACLMVVAVLIIAFLAAMVIYQHVSKKDNKLCSTPECVQASSSILAPMNRSADPCQDFYQYICGNWKQTVTIPESRSKYSVFSIVGDLNKVRIKQLLESDSTLVNGQPSKTVEKMRKFHKMCLDQEKINELDAEPLKQLTRDLGGWTITDSGWDRDSWSMEKILAKINMHNGSPLFSFDITIDYKNNTNYRMSFSQPSLTLLEPEEYNTSYSKYTSLRNAFLDFGSTVGMQLGSDYNETYKKMEDIYNLEKALSENFVPKEILRQPDIVYHKMSIKDLKNLLGNWINLDLFLKELFRTDVSEETEVIVYTPDYLRQLGEIISNTDKSVLANYMIWTVVNNLLGYLPLKYTESALILEKVESGIKKLDPVGQRCIDKTNTVFGFGTGALYVQKYFPESSRNEIKDILDKVQTAFGDNLPGVDWMDEETRQKALDKLQNIKPMIGYPDWNLNVTRLDQHYENVTITDDQLFTTYIKHLNVEVQRSLDRLGTVPDRSKWEMNAFEVNAYYSSEHNSIAFPAGILQRPFYDPEFPRSYSFGSIGAVMGHEMTHGFDDQGRMFDKNGNLENWWTNRSSKAFTEKTQCMIQQYSDFKFQGYNIMGERTIGENIADNGGVKSAYTAFSKWLPTSSVKKYPGLDLTPEQLYFIGFGQIWCSYYTHAFAETSILTDPHSPSPVRPNGMAINSRGFSKAFHCPKGSPMNPEKKCEVW